MATEKLFKIAGISTLNDQTKLRFANDMSRIKVLLKGGHENIRLIELPRAMTKQEAAEYLQNVDKFQDAEDQQIIWEFLDKYEGVSTQPPVVEADEEQTETADEELEPF